MALNRAALERLRILLGAAEAKRIEDNATIAERIERHWLRELDKLLAGIIAKTVDGSADGTLKIPDDLEDQLGEFFLRHALATAAASERTLLQPEHVTPPSAELAKKKPKKTHMPRTIREIRAAWDVYRKTGKLPQHEKEKAAKVKALYVKKVQELWRKNTEDFVEGHARKKNGEWNPDAFDKESARKAIQKAIGVSRNRARTIVETETTRYYNQARRDFYDEIDTVDGYLYAIVRDSATTRWCLSRAGLVFLKGTALLKKNTPPCHWNCRSELLPLSRLNPTHQRILNDETLRASNHKLVPLPPGWNA